MTRICMGDWADAAPYLLEMSICAAVIDDAARCGLQHTVIIFGGTFVLVVHSRTPNFRVAWHVPVSQVLCSRNFYVPLCFSQCPAEGSFLILKLSWAAVSLRHSSFSGVVSQSGLPHDMRIVIMMTFLGPAVG